MPNRFTLRRRAAGILLHPTSLPGPHGIGDLGPDAQRFVDFLVEAGQSWWQMLPVGPVHLDGSPYSSDSAFAGSPLLLSLESLAGEGLLTRGESVPPRLRADRVAYPAVMRFKLSRLRTAFARFRDLGGLKTTAFERFGAAGAAWLEPYATYCAMRRLCPTRPWRSWPRVPRARAPELEIERCFARFLQFQFDRQWTALKRYANDRGVGLVGDIPLFVSYDSADVSQHQDLFDLDRDGRPRTISGVPPDVFSTTGQLWGHPQYRWPRHKATRFAWWTARFRRMFDLFDAVRIDHFLGFYRVWAVPGRARTALHGRWVKTPGRQLFQALQRKLGQLEIIAEDLGPGVPASHRLRESLGFPGMRLLHFAFGNDAGDRYNQPHNHPRNCVVFPGTHDNETTVGWFERLKHAARRRRDFTPYDRVLRYVGTSGRAIHWDIIRLAYASPANTAMIPLQDVLGLDNTARMNTPATTRGNWQWRFRSRQLTARHAARLRELAQAYDRIPPTRHSG